MHTIISFQACSRELRLCVCYASPFQVASKANTVVNNFIHVPFKLEECLTFGLALCTDSFLYAVTFLPLRVFLSALLAFTSFVYPRCVANPCSWDLPASASTDLAAVSAVCVRVCRGRHRRHRDFHRNNAYDLMRGLIVVIACLVLQTLQISRVYHYIRGQVSRHHRLVCSETSSRTHRGLRCGCGVLVNVQATIKLYVLTAMFEILDKLMISFGQDTLDSLYWSAKKNSDRK